MYYATDKVLTYHKEELEISELMLSNGKRYIFDIFNILSSSEFIHDYFFVGEEPETNILVYNDYILFIRHCVEYIITNLYFGNSHNEFLESLEDEAFAYGAEDYSSKFFEHHEAMCVYTIGVDDSVKHFMDKTYNYLKELIHSVVTPDKLNRPLYYIPVRWYIVSINLKINTFKIELIL